MENTRIVSPTEEEIISNARIVTDMVNEMYDVLKEMTKNMDGKKRIYLITRAINSLFISHFGMEMTTADDILKKMEEGQSSPPLDQT